MSRNMRAGRAAGLAGLAALAFTALPTAAPPVMAQEREEERPPWSFGVELVESAMRPMLGVMVGDGDNELGVVVTDVLEDGPAEKAGIIDGDVILSVDGHDLSEPLEGEDEEDPDLPGQRLRALVGEVPEGEAVTLEIDRDGERLTFAVVPEAMPFYSWGTRSGAFRGMGDWWSDESRRQETLDRIRELSEGIRNPTWMLQPDSAGWRFPGTLRFRADTLLSRPPALRWGGNWPGRWDGHGLDLVELNPGLGAYFGTAEGVLVADVEDESPLGLRPGDVVVAVDGRVVDDIAELHRILGSYENDEEIAFRIFRDGAQTTVTGTISG